MIINDENREFAKSLLEILDLKTAKKLVRRRLVYKLNNVKFEIDKYIEPAMNVVAIEGNNDEVDNVYSQLKELVDSNIVNE